MEEQRKRKQQHPSSNRHGEYCCALPWWPQAAAQKRLLITLIATMTCFGCCTGKDTASLVAEIADLESLRAAHLPPETSLGKQPNICPLIGYREDFAWSLAHQPNRGTSRFKNPNLSPGTTVIGLSSAAPDVLQHRPPSSMGNNRTVIWR